MSNIIYHFFGPLIEFIKKSKKILIALLIFYSFTFVAYHAYVDIKRKILLREGLKCDKRLPHLIPEVNNLASIEMSQGNKKKLFNTNDN